VAVVTHRFQQITRILTRTALSIAFTTILSFSPRHAAAGEQGRSQPVLAAIDCSRVPILPHDPVYRIPLRVHLGESMRSPEDFKVILEEINDIWLSQAGICFEMQIVLHDEPLEQGMDIWFLPILPGGPDLNGYFRGDHNIQVRDTPILGNARHPAHYPAARTAAHECGHGLSLMHRQDSEDNLMRSKTYGWQLNGKEIQEARRAAAEKGLQDTRPRNCGEPGRVSLSGSLER
jgi:hypothetical protein